MKPRLLGALAACVFVFSACGRNSDDLSPTDAAAAIRATPTFTTRPHSPIARDLVEVVAVRRIGHTSTEVEFTWRDMPPPAGRPAQLYTSMALFRLQQDGRWVITSLYKMQ